MLDNPQPNAKARMNAGPRFSNVYMAIMKVRTTIPKTVRVKVPRYVGHPRPLDHPRVDAEVNRGRELCAMAVRSRR
jgi:hypothetical protein